MKHKSYVEAKGAQAEAIVDWHKVLQMSEMTVLQASSLTLSAMSWVTCACGSLCEIIPRDNQGKPLDIRLEAYGSRFYHCIYNNYKEILNASKESLAMDANTPIDKTYFVVMSQILEARNILESIEKRAAEIIEEMMEEQIERNGTVEL